MYKVKLHCGSGYVKGDAKSYRYVTCSLFGKRFTKDGKIIWHNTGIHTHPRRSDKLAINDGKFLAQQYNCAFDKAYGSLHNRQAD